MLDIYTLMSHYLTFDKVHVCDRYKRFTRKIFYQNRVYSPLPALVSPCRTVTLVHVDICSRNRMHQSIGELARL